MIVKKQKIQILQKIKKTNIPTYAVTSDDSQKPTESKPIKHFSCPIQQKVENQSASEQHP